MANENLEPCPWGHEAKSARNRAGGLYIFCPDQDCPASVIEGSDASEDGKTIAAWNHRPAEDALRKALKDILLWNKNEIAFPMGLTAFIEAALGKAVPDESH
jgi:hypothetical protein